MEKSINPVLNYFLNMLTNCKKLKISIITNLLIEFHQADKLDMIQSILHSLSKIQGELD